MKNCKKWIALLLAAATAAAMLLAGCHVEIVTDTPEEEPAGSADAYQPAYQPKDSDPLLLWEVTSPEESGKKLYLAGTIHIGPSPVTELPKPLETALQSSDELAVEVDLLSLQENFQEMLDLSTKYGYYEKENETAKDHLSKETYEKATKVLEENGLDPEGLQYYKVSQWSSSLNDVARQKAGLSSENGVDLYLMQQAKDAGKPILEVESAESQMALNDSFSDELQEMILLGALEVDATAKGMQQLYENWLAGDAEALAAQESSEEGAATAAEQKLLDEYYEKMLYERNEKMAKKAEQLLKGTKQVLFAVGAGHMGGEKGIVRLLEKDGYTVRQIARSGETYTASAGGETVSAAA